MDRLPQYGPGERHPATYTECFQFMMRPLPRRQQRTPLYDRVLNNSRGCPLSEGCTTHAAGTIVNNTQAAGIFVEVSAGNSARCSTVADPPGEYSASFSTGAIDIPTLAGFSSRVEYLPSESAEAQHLAQESTSDQPPEPATRALPDVRTGWLGHVIGAVALLWSARACLWCAT